MSPLSLPHRLADSAAERLIKLFLTRAPGDLGWTMDGCGPCGDPTIRSRCMWIKTRGLQNYAYVVIDVLSCMTSGCVHVHLSMYKMPTCYKNGLCLIYLMCLFMFIRMHALIDVQLQMFIHLCTHKSTQCAFTIPHTHTPPCFYVL